MQTSDLKPTGGAGSRLGFLDGIRGWACLSVVAAHTLSPPSWSKTPANILFSIFSDGRFAVACFFVLSGFALSRIPSTSVLRFCLGRYPRLAIPVACVTCFAWLAHPTHSPLNLIQFNASNDFFVFFSSLEPSHWQIPWKLQPWNLTPSASNGVVLWTMYIEMQGSFLVMLYVLAKDHLVRPKLLLTLVSVVLFVTQTHLFNFVLGIWLSSIADNLKICGQIYWYLCFCAFIGLYYINYCQETYWLHTIPELSAVVFQIITLLRCTFVFYLFGPGSVLESRLSLSLGRISFPLYLLHMWARDTSRLLHAAPLGAVNFAQTLALAIPVAYVFSFVDTWAIRKSRDIAGYFIDVVEAEEMKEKTLPL